MITNNFHLNKTALGWQFNNEEILEDFLFLHLSQTLGLKGLARQYIVKNQRCDILATDSTNRLVVLELKNTEDRGIVQQLTRYYHALLEEKPFANQIDYNLPVHLIAIAPSFHRDNSIDRLYHQLEFQFLQFAIEQKESNFYLNLKDIDQGKIFKIEIPHEEEQPNDLPPVPNTLFKLMKNCSEAEQEKILQIRQKILLFDRKMQEIAIAGSILYGNGHNKTSKYCAEFSSDKDGNILLFLWIPLKCGHSSQIRRAIIWTDWQYQTLIEGYVTSGIGTEINRRRRELNNLIKTIQKGQNSYTNFFVYDNNGRQHDYYLNINSVTAKKYIKAVRESKKSIQDNYSPVLLEQIQFYKFDVELTKQKTGMDLTIDYSNCYKSLESLVYLALEKWSNKL